MTDDKGAGEGPYGVFEEADGNSVLEGPTGKVIFGFGNDAREAAWESARDLNKSYAAGRKSMEKDFREAVAWANRMDDCCTPKKVYEVFMAWKKARGIE